MAILNTDLTAAYKTISHPLLVNKLDHIGIRGKEQQFFISYLNNRRFYTEVQGFSSDIKELPPMSVIQGSQLSGTLYTLFTLETTKLNDIMRDKELFLKLTGKPLKVHKNIKHTVISYVDDTQHVVSGNSMQEVHEYLKDLHLMLIEFYRQNSLQINALKTEFICMDKSIETENLTISDEKDNIILPVNTMKVLGIRINKDNNLRSHLSTLLSKMQLTYNKLKDCLPHISKKNQRIIIDSKIRGQINMTLPLLLNQSKAVQKQAETLIIRVNRWKFKKI